MNLADFLTNETYQIFLTFCRVGTAIMILPAFNSSYVNPRVRLIIALAISVIVSPLVENFPSAPGHPIETLYHIFSEVTVGFLIGSLARIMAAAIHVAGMIMSMQSALAQAVLFDPNQSAQGAIFGNFMQLMAVVLIFSFNLHHLMIYAIVDSYAIFPIGSPLPYNDFADSAATTLARSFLVGVQLASPLIVSGILINLSAGLLARLMPSFQVYFVLMPAQIMISIFIFMATLSASLMWYMGYLQESFTTFLR